MIRTTSPPSHRRRGRTVAAVAAALLVIATFAGRAGAQASKPVTEADPTAAIAALRGELVDSFNKGDVDRLLSHLDPDVVATWQNGEVCRGPEAVRAYYNKMMVGPDRVVAKLSANPVVDDRHVYGDWAVSWGNLHDAYELKDGSRFTFDSRFTATIARRGAEWKVTSFHASINAFDNPVLKIVAKKSGTWAGVAAGLLGLVAGVGLGLLVRRRKARVDAA
jgi:ketosteroid isomerase-like protein